MEALAPFVILWSAGVLACGLLGFGWQSLVMPLAPIGLFGLGSSAFRWFAGDRSGRPLLRFVVLGAVGGLGAVAVGLARQAVFWALAPIALAWFWPIVRYFHAEARQRRSEADLALMTQGLIPAVDPEDSPEGMAARQALAAALAADDMDEAVRIAAATPDARLIPLPGPDMDNGLERLGDHVAATDPRLGRRLYGLAAHGAVIAFAFATAGGAGLATQARLARLQRKLLALPR